MTPVDLFTTLAFELGPRAFDAFRQRGPLKDDGAAQQYVNCITRALDLMLSLEALRDEQLREGTRGLLQSCAVVVQSTYPPNKVRVLANYMSARNPTAEDPSEALFCAADRIHNSFAAFLHLEMWSHDPAHHQQDGTGSQAHHPQVRLPVEPGNGDRWCLFGAPQAYRMNQAQFIDDTLDPTNWKGCEEKAIKRGLQEYFERHRSEFVSFVSIPVEIPTLSAGLASGIHHLAVVNIQGDRKRLFGWSKSSRQRLILLLAPFLHVLGHCLARLHAGQSGQAGSLGSI